MSSGLVTPQDSIGNWTSFSPDRRRSGRFSVDSNGGFGQSNRWSLGTQLSSVSFAECMSLKPHSVNSGLIIVVPAAMPCDEDKTQEWNGVETSVDLFNEEEDDNIFHPDDEIIVDPKESMEAPIKRVSPSPKLVLIVGEYWDKSTNSRMAVKRDYAPNCSCHRPPIQTNPASFSTH